jgi:hypothetical protein
VIAELERELHAVGIPRARRARILAEIADHLACDPSADLGEPRVIARRFADELGTAYARRAGFASFLALAPFGFACVVLFALHRTVNVPIVLGTQLAFVGGTLAALRAWRIRRAVAVPAAQASIVLRRVGLALAGTALTAGGLFPASVPVAAIGCASAAVCAAALVRAARLRPADGAPADGDLATDLGIDETPWRLALLIAGGVALCIAVAGAVQADGIDGALRGLVDGSACLAGFAVLGRPLGLR